MDAISEQALCEYFAEPEHQLQRQRALEAAVAAIVNEVGLQVPRSEAERRNAFADWLAEQHDRLRPLLQAEWQKAFPELADADALGECLWSDVANWLRVYALRGQAAKWISHNMGNATTLGLPQRTETGWRIPIGVSGYGEELGQIVLDADGNVLLEQTTTHQHILEQIRGRKFSAPATTAR